VCNIMLNLGSCIFVYVIDGTEVDEVVVLFFSTYITVSMRA
jgi:hypothetical protein